MERTLRLSITLIALWLFLSGHYDPLLISLGVASVALAVLIALRMDVVDHEGHPSNLTIAAVAFFPWLMWEMVKSNIDVARRVLSPSLPISPRVIEVRASQRTIAGRVIYANSITLTPGTVTIDLEDDVLRVHALTAESAASLAEGKMDRRVSEMSVG